MNSIPMVSLGELIKHQKDFIKIDDTVTYSLCRVQLHGRGVVLRNKKLGREIKTKKQQVCKSGQFIVAEIDAKMGGFGIIPPELDGAIVSSHYYLYNIDTSKLYPKFLEHYIQSNNFLDQVEPKGSTNYASIRPYEVLDYSIPLPSLEKQKNIVKFLDSVKEQTKMLRRLSEQTMQDVEVLFPSVLNKIFQT